MIKCVSVTWRNYIVLRNDICAQFVQRKKSNFTQVYLSDALLEYTPDAEVIAIKHRHWKLSPEMYHWKVCFRNCYITKVCYNFGTGNKF